MFHRIEIENFLSIKDRQKIDLMLPRSAPQDSEKFGPLWLGSDARAPKVVALFGPNASGKSNVLRALTFVSWFLRHSFNVQPDAVLPLVRFNDEEGQEAPTCFTIYTGGNENLGAALENPERQCRYCYEVVFQGRVPSVQREVIYYWPAGVSRRVKLFDRIGKKVTAAKAFGLKGYDVALAHILRPNASAIATLAQLEHPASRAIWQSAGLINSNIFHERSEAPDNVVLHHFAQSPELVAEFNQDVRRFDLGIRSMVVSSTPTGPQAWFHHEGFSNPLSLIFESHGTRQFLKLYPQLHYVLQNGGIAIIDELDASIHPMLLPEILGWFYDRNRNKYGAQLWITCHNASLLEELEKEQIIFCEKTLTGTTQIFGLRDITAIRRTDNYYRKYLSGAFGALPRIG